MNIWRSICLVSFGAMLEYIMGAGNGVMWITAFLISSCAWFWSTVGQGVRRAVHHLQYRIAGRSLPRRADDPQALAAEIAALQAQIAQLRDTATSFDVSFDDTLQRLDQRLQRLEQQSAYVTLGR